MVVRPNSPKVRGRVQEGDVSPPAQSAKPKMLSPKIILRNIFCPKVLSFGNILGGGGGGGKLSSLEGPPSLDETLKF